MDPNERPTAEAVREPAQQCTAPHPLFGLDITLVLAGIAAGPIWILMR